MNRVIFTAFLGAAALFAQPDPQQQNPQGDPPSRVARLNWISGDVAFQPASVDDWSSATLNYPLTTGDHLFVNAGGRAELHIDGSAIRLNANSNFGFLNLNDSIVQMSLNEGAFELRLRQLAQDDSFEIDTPNGALTLLRAGEYRIDTDPSGNSTLVTVRSGQAEMFQDGNSLLITPHQSVWFRDGRAPEIDAENARDPFDDFAMSRNDAEDALPRHDYVPDTMIGYRDLDAYGRWVNDPLYGEIWMPPVDPGWTPYSTGRWAFVEPWGWTWVDEAPWGFAPFHYGRWAMVRGSWGWIPGERTYRPVYAPALVGFIGGGGFGVSVGWFPLGPREPFIPAWGASRTYIRNVNVMHVTNINVVNVTNINYVNRQNVTVVSQADFASARPVRGSAVQMSVAQVRGATVIGTAPQVVPARVSVSVGTSRPAPQVPVRAVVAHAAPPPPPVSFQARQQALQANRGLPLRPEQVAQIRTQQPSAVVARPAVRAVGSAPVPANTPAPRPMPVDRMSSRPPTAPPLPQTRPMQPAPGAQPPATFQRPNRQPAEAPTPAAQPPATFQRPNRQPAEAPTPQQPAPAAQPPATFQRPNRQPAEAPTPQQPAPAAQPPATFQRPNRQPAEAPAPQQPAPAAQPPATFQRPNRQPAEPPTPQQPAPAAQPPATFQRPNRQPAEAPAAQQPAPAAQPPATFQRPNRQPAEPPTPQPAARPAAQQPAERAPAERAGKPTKAPPKDQEKR